MINEDYKGRILVVDDSPPSIDMVKTALEGEGYEVIVATTGEKAISRAGNTEPDLILLDVVMPEMDGFEICRRLKIDEKTNEIPVIFMTGLTTTQSKVDGFEAGGIDYVTKPIAIGEVLARVKTHLNLRYLSKKLESRNQKLRREIAERKQAEKEVRRLNAELENRVNERTAELAEANASLMEEIDQHRRTEEALRKSTRAYKALCDCNQVVVHATDEKELLQIVCNIIREDCGYPLVWIGLAEQDREKHVKLAAMSGYEDDFPESIRITWGDTESGKGPVGTAIRAGKPVIKKDISANPDFASRGGEALGHGYESSAAFPIFMNEEVLGALSVHSPKEDAFSAEEAELLTELAEDLGYGIMALRMREESKNMEEKLRQAQKMEAIGTLAGGIAHDFNNILSVIIGQAELMGMYAKNRDYPSIRSGLDELLKAAYRASELVKQILTISRKTDCEKQIVQVSLIANEAVKFLRSTLPSTIQIRQKIERLAGAVLCDPSQIHQIFMNLCTNAAHAMKEGGVLEIVLEKFDIDNSSAEILPDEQPGPYLRLIVRDTGIGMDQGTLSRIFDPYFTTKRKGEGTGLGLAVVQGIVKNLGGYITVESRPGQGTTFSVFLPRIERESTVVENSCSIPEGTERILFVDDEEPIVETTRQMLERLNYKVAVEMDSVRALEVFREQPDSFDLVITDMIMPKMTGLDLSRKIHSIRPDLPIIICTGYSDNLKKDEFESLGIQAVIEKPLRFRDFAEIIRKVFDG